MARSGRPAATVHPSLHPSAWWGALWAWWALRRLRASLGSDGISTQRPRPLPLPGAGPLGVSRALQHLGATCLERSLIFQSLALSRSGRAPDVVIGVRTGDTGDLAHAWLDGEPADGYAEIHRLAARP